MDKLYCPNCGHGMISSTGGWHCPICGYSSCTSGYSTITINSKRYCPCCGQEIKECEVEK